MTLSIPKTTDSSFYMKVFNKNHEKLNVIGTHDMINNATVFVEDGIYQALTLEQSADEFNRGNLCFIPIKPEIKTTSSIAWKSDKPNLTMEVIPIGKVISDLTIFDEIDANVEMTFEVENN